MFLIPSTLRTYSVPVVSTAAAPQVDEESEMGVAVRGLVALHEGVVEYLKAQVRAAGAVREWGMSAQVCVAGAVREWGMWIPCAGGCGCRFWWWYWL